MAGTAGSYSPPMPGGIIEIPVSQVDLLPTPSVWQPCVSTVIQQAGIYQLDAIVRASLRIATSANSYIYARLFDVTAGAIVPLSSVVANNLGVSQSPPDGQVIIAGETREATIATRYAVAAGTTIRLEARYVFASGTAAEIAMIVNEATGSTTLRWLRVG